MVTEWFLVVVLAGNATGLVPLQQFETRAQCEQQLAVEATVQQLRGQTIVSAHCQYQRRPALRPVTGQILTR